MAKRLRYGAQIVDHASGLKVSQGLDGYVRAADGDLKHLVWNSVLGQWESEAEEVSHNPASLRTDGMFEYFQLNGLDNWWWNTGGTITADPDGTSMKYDGRTTPCINFHYFDTGRVEDFDLAWTWKVDSATAENPCYWEISIGDAFNLANGGIRMRIYYNGSTYMGRVYDQADTLLGEANVSGYFGQWETFRMKKRGSNFSCDFFGYLIDTTVTTWDIPEQTYWGIRVADCVLHQKQILMKQPRFGQISVNTAIPAFNIQESPVNQWNPENGFDIDVRKWVTRGLTLQAKSTAQALNLRNNWEAANVGIFTSFGSYMLTSDADHITPQPWIVPSWTAPTAPVGLTASVLDDFNRANGGLGTNWTDIVAAGWATPAISSNKVSTNGTDAAAYWDTTAFSGACQEVFCSFEHAINLGVRLKQPATDYHGIWVKIKKNIADGGYDLTATLSNGTAPHTGQQKSMLIDTNVYADAFSEVTKMWVHTERIDSSFIDKPIRVRVYLPNYSGTVDRGTPTRWTCVADWTFTENSAPNHLDTGYIGFTTSTGNTDYSVIDNFGGGDANPIGGTWETGRVGEKNETWYSSYDKTVLTTDWNSLVLRDYNVFGQEGNTNVNMVQAGANSYSFSTYDGAPDFLNDIMVYVAVTSTRTGGSAASKPTVTSANLTWTEVGDVVFDSTGDPRSRLTVFRSHVTGGPWLAEDVTFDYAGVTHSIAVVLYSFGQSNLNTGTNGADSIVQTVTNSLTLTKPTKSAYETAVANSVPTGYWKLDEPSGSSFNDSSAGSPNDLTKGGTPTMGGDSVFSDGAGLESNGDTTADGSSGVIQTGFDEWSLECIVKCTAATTDDMILMHNGVIGTDGYGLRGISSDGSPYFAVNVPNDGTGYFSLDVGPFGGQPMQYGVWYHLLVTCEPANHRICMFIDGILQSVTALGGNTPTTGFYVLQASGATDCAGWHMTQAAIYDRALTQGEVWDHAEKSHFLSDTLSVTMAAKSNPNNGYVFFIGGDADKETGNTSHDFPALNTSRSLENIDPVFQGLNTVRDQICMAGAMTTLDIDVPEFTVRDDQGYINTSKSSTGNGFGVIGVELAIDPAWDNVPSLAQHTYINPVFQFGGQDHNSVPNPARIGFTKDIVTEIRYVAGT
jgi:hypothetical protein